MDSSVKIYNQKADRYYNKAQKCLNKSKFEYHSGTYCVGCGRKKEAEYYYRKSLNLYELANDQLQVADDLSLKCRIKICDVYSQLLNIELMHKVPNSNLVECYRHQMQSHS